MKTKEFLEYMIECKVQGVPLASIKDIAKANGVSKVAVWKNLKNLERKGLVKRVAHGKYELQLQGTEYCKGFLIRRIRFLEDEVNHYKNLYEGADQCNNELEHSYNELRKSLDFQDNQNKIKDKIIKAQEERIRILESRFKESRFRRLLRKIGI